ncbi:488_t:CDS:2 [Dentiscutata heterogama]|uniref:488_t:CDS:1 n=1 Tax=Dentiscutata heterogama TaxID=1316150 RepID=A0ACA9LU83_9GLOM|nr:488_t:CDS:2 [Dentiscutata heterogama]
MSKRFLQNQNQFNQYLADMTQQQQATNDYLQTLVTGNSKSIETSESIFDTDTKEQRNTGSKGLNIHLPVFSGKDGENVLTWLLQVDLLFKAKKVEDEERLELRQISMVQEYAEKFRNLLGQIEEIVKPDKVMYFTEGLKGATKAEINYQAPKTLDEAVKLATSYDTAMYRTKNNYNYLSRRNTRSSEESWRYKNTPSYIPQS